MRAQILINLHLCSVFMVKKIRLERDIFQVIWLTSCKSEFQIPSLQNVFVVSQYILFSCKSKHEWKVKQ